MKHWFFKPCYFFIQVLWAYNLNKKVIYKSPFFKFFDSNSFDYLIQNLSQLCDIILYIYPHKY